MRNKKHKLVLAAILAIFIIASYAHAFSMRDRKSIEIAFQNGFLNAMKLSAEDYARIKADEEFLKNAILVYSQEYLKIVEKMNAPSKAQ